jgi:hypothetical protein
MYHYGATYCPTGGTTGFTSQEEIDVPDPCASSGVPPCIMAPGYMHSKSQEVDVIPHFVHGSPSLEKPVDPTLPFKDYKCKSHEILHHDCLVKTSQGLKLVRLMLRVVVPDGAGPSGPRYFLPIGWEIGLLGAKNLETKNVVSEEGPCHCTVMHGSCKYHVVLVKPKKAT